MKYSHRQISLPSVVVADLIGLAGIACAVFVGDPLVETGVILVVVGIALFAFSVLTSKVEDGHVTASFTFGWPRHRIPVTDIVRVEIVRNSGWLGWGLRKIPGGWMYNVWGFDAVEITRSSGKKFRIGTDDPQGLETALQRR